MSYIHGLSCGVKITDPDLHRSQPLQHLSLVLRIWLLGHAFHLSSSPVHQKILKYVIQSLQTSTIVGLCWDLDLQAPFFTTWLPCIPVNRSKDTPCSSEETPRSLCLCQQPKPFLTPEGPATTQPPLSAQKGTTGARVPKGGLDLLRNRAAPPGTAVDSPIPTLKDPGLTLVLHLKFMA